MKYILDTNVFSKMARQRAKNANNLAIGSVPGGIALTRHLIDVRHNGTRVLNSCSHPAAQFDDMETSFVRHFC
ncbi:hypothetical protein HF313_06400 [Massilia atriviolacea]|uniref:hypothetical protein n=1 Tax=Massilia atriviolacea TaxID=2495579 RepID=UPI000F7F4857|nr:hypothetical protein [Massilia atriviolacea]